MLLVSLAFRGFEDATWPGFNASDWRAHLRLLRRAGVAATHLIGWTKERPSSVAVSIALFLLERAQRRWAAQQPAGGAQAGVKECLRDARAMLTTEAAAVARSKHG